MGVKLTPDVDTQKWGKRREGTGLETCTKTAQ